MPNTRSTVTRTAQLDPREAVTTRKTRDPLGVSCDTKGTNGVFTVPFLSPRLPDHTDRLGLRLCLLPWVALPGSGKDLRDKLSHRMFLEISGWGEIEKTGPRPGHLVSHSDRGSVRGWSETVGNVGPDEFRIPRPRSTASRRWGDSGVGVDYLASSPSSTMTGPSSLRRSWAFLIEV